MRTKRQRKKRITYTSKIQHQFSQKTPFIVAILFMGLLYQTQFFQTFIDEQEKTYDKHVNQENLLAGFFDFSSTNNVLNLGTDLKNYVTELFTGVDFTQLYSFIHDGFGFMTEFVEASQAVDTSYKYRYVSDELDLEQRPVTTTVDPLVYLYNTHTSERYNNEQLDPEEDRIVSVVDASTVVSQALERQGINSIVEYRDVGDLLNSQNWAYSMSYDASRMYLEDTALEYNSIKYFVDIHRDSVTEETSTFEYNGEVYARIMFVVGAEHERYAQNLAFAQEIEALIHNMCPGISRGIIEKKGEYVNGIYNQDFSPNTVLIEVGGVDNTFEEVENTALLIAKALEIIILSEQ